MPVEYVTDDATRPRGPGPKVIAHCVNDAGKWGRGFVRALDERWPFAGARYCEWSTGKLRATDPPFELGAVQFVKVESSLWVPNVWVANLVGQHKTIREEPVPIRYEALTMGFQTIATFCKEHEASVHAPRLGAGLARGSWPQIVEIIERELVARGVSVTIYDLPT